MSTVAQDTSRIIEYHRDKWMMERLPFALILCLGGLALLVYGDPTPPRHGVILSLMAFAAFVAVFLTVSFSLHRLSRTTSSIGQTAFWIIAILAFIFLPARTSTGGVGRAFTSVFLGWLLLLLGVVWVVYVVGRHMAGSRATLRLEPAGIRMHAPGLEEFRIPWTEVQSVEKIDIASTSWWTVRSYLMIFHDVTAITISKDFYDRSLHVRSAFMRGPGWESVFIEKGPVVQMALHHDMFAIAPEAIRIPVEARWKAYRDQPSPLPQSGTVSHSQPIVYGRWSLPLTWWQTTKFVVPIAGMLAIAANVAGVWDTPSLRANRAEQAEALARHEAKRQAAVARKERDKRETEERMERQRRLDEIRRDLDRTFGR